MHISSLWSKGGIGTFGKEAFEFVDFLEKSGQSFWQILPLGPTSYGDSPYQSFSAFAGNPYFIDLEKLTEQGLLEHQDWCYVNWGEDETKVDYEKLYNNRYICLKKAFSNFIENKEYKAFCKENAFWLDDYSLFMTLKNANGGKTFLEWENALRTREKGAIKKAKETFADEISFQKFMQFEFFCQWTELKSYANSKGIKIIGDLPIYVAFDSSDLWANKECFSLNEDYTPKEVAGVPPDAFSEDGQLWGNPLYDWQFMKQNDFSWWKQRIAHAFKLFDTVRIDHFRGFASYYCIPYGDKNAKNGKWRKGPGTAFFKAMKEHFGELSIIAEDLGFLTADVKKLLKSTGFPGMKILQFAFDSREDSDYLPHNYDKNCVVYVGTHDNDTVMGWFENCKAEDIDYCKNYLRLSGEEGYNWGIIKAAMATTADTCIITMQDVLGLGSEARMNTPSTLGNNWKWRIKGECINDWLAGIIYNCTDIYRRLPTEE